jgi:hypothetical protein
MTDGKIYTIKSAQDINILNIHMYINLATQCAGYPASFTKNRKKLINQNGTSRNPSINGAK